ncbi:MAG: aldo/keto reductase [Candidatus Heimdallarchaeota archaeon]|nr:MAG: aldo/keto reductase [Candidatus Heimdallarchaeota archaeon]
MKYKLLGKSGLRVSELSLGTMTFGEDWGWGSSKEVAKQVFQKYVDVGGNFIDTACNYTNGTSEKFVGEFIEGDRDRYVIATKYTLHDYRFKQDPNAGGNHRKNLLRTVKGSLERLQTDYIDLLYLHMWDYTTPIHEVMRTLDDLISSTKINYIGISDTPAWIVAKANTMAEVHGWNPFIAFQFPYNLSFRDPEREIIPMCKNLDLAMTVWAPLGAGLYTGKYTRQNQSKGRLTEGKWGVPSEDRLEIAKEVDKIADEIGCSSANVALNWIRQQDGLFIPIFGVTTFEQLEDNLQCLDFEINDNHIKRLAEKVDFKFGFPKGFLLGNKDLYHGETFDLLENHRKYE